MARECFSDRTIASTLNELFICIRIDCEDRPDIDRVYQTALQLLTQERGGWPLTLFLTPDDRIPFFGGTFFPAQPNGSLPGFAEVARRVHAYFQSDRKIIEDQTDFLKSQFQQLTAPAPNNTPFPDAVLESASNILEELFDPSHGGFGKAPKQPPVLEIRRLMRRWAASQHAEAPDLKALYMAALTLTRMAESGIHDAVAGGFFDHCVDTAWNVPNFDKPLAVNGLLLDCYAQAAVATGEPLFAKTARSTADWLLDALRSDSGAFYNGIGPDPAVRPELHYLWNLHELRELLSQHELAALAARFGLDPSAARDDERHHLHAQHSWDVVAQRTGSTQDESQALVDQGLLKLKSCRRGRRGVRPDKRLRIAHSAHAIRGLARAGRVLGEPSYAAAALIAFVRCIEKLGDQCHETVVVLDDVSALLLAAIELLQYEWTAPVYHQAQILVDLISQQYFDAQNGTLWTTSLDSPGLIWRPRWYADEGLPSGAGMAALGLLRWGYLTGSRTEVLTATTALQAAAPYLHIEPHRHLALLEALDEGLKPTTVVILRGPEEVTHRWSLELSRLYAPQRLVFVWPASDALPENALHMPSGNAGIAYLWRGFELEAAVTDFAELIRRLRDGITLDEV
jgi:uncharacterized protein YyaL (SSP411 family)